ncbi:hypothetical protein EHYA_10215 [Embleya hyalina]|uniref:Uncharacterized protein n=1 Tax=Embleya hyalina TaxID=516124 RepID=A0A401Z6K1_9ACTN|nr:hypothetical protein EHYA_10215 [Embleya hyalina]
MFGGPTWVDPFTDQDRSRRRPADRSRGRAEWASWRTNSPDRRVTADGRPRPGSHRRREAAGGGTRHEPPAVPVTFAVTSASPSEPVPTKREFGRLAVSPAGSGRSLGGILRTDDRERVEYVRDPMIRRSRRPADPTGHSGIRHTRIVLGPAARPPPISAVGSSPTHQPPSAGEATPHRAAAISRRRRAGLRTPSSTEAAHPSRHTATPHRGRLPTWTTVRRHAHPPIGTRKSASPGGTSGRHRARRDIRPRYPAHSVSTESGSRKARGAAVWRDSRPARRPASPRSTAARALRDRHDDLAPCVPGVDVPYGLRGFGEGEGAVEYRGQPAALDRFAEEAQIVRAFGGDQAA